MLLPRAKISPSHASVAGDLGAQFFILHDYHLDDHHVNGILYAGVFVELRCHGHQDQNVLLWRQGERVGEGGGAAEQRCEFTSIHRNLKSQAQTVSESVQFCQ